MSVSDLEFVSAAAGVNQNPQALSIHRETMTAVYASSNILTFFDIGTKQVKGFSKKHDDKKINTVTIDGDLLVAGSSGGDLLFYDFSDHDEPCSVQTLRDSIVRVSCVSSGEKHYVAAITCNKMLHTFSLQGNTVERTGTHLFASLLETVEIALTDGSPFVLVGDTDALFHILSLQEGKGLVPVKSIKAHERAIKSIRVREAGGDLYVATSSQEEVIRVWRLGPEFEVSLETVIPEAHKDSIESLLWVRESGTDEVRLASCSLDGYVKLWKEYKGQIWVKDAEFRVESSTDKVTSLYGLAWDGKHIYAHGSRGYVSGWSLETGEAFHVFTGHFRRVTGIDVDPLGELIATSSDDQTVRIWTSLSGAFREIFRPIIHGYDVKDVQFIKYRNFDIIVSSEEHNIRVLRGTSTVQKTLESIGYSQHNIRGFHSCVGSVVPPLNLSNKPIFASSDKQSLVEKFTVQAFPTEDHLMNYTLWPEVFKVYGQVDDTVVTTISGEFLLTSAKILNPKDSMIYLWTIMDTGMVKLVFKFHLGFKRDVSGISVWGDDVFVVSRDRSIAVLWIDRKAKKLVQRSVIRPAHTMAIHDVTVLDGERVLTISKDRSAKVWRFDDGNLTCLETFKFNSIPTCIGSHKELVLIGFKDGTVRTLGSKVLAEFGGTVNRIKFFSREGVGHVGIVSDDTSLRVFKYLVEE